MTPNRFRGLNGAGMAALAAGDRQSAADYYAKFDCVGEKRRHRKGRTSTSKGIPREMMRRIRDMCILPCERITPVLRRWTNGFAFVIVIAGFIIGMDLPCLADPEVTNPEAVALDPDYAAAKQALERKDWKEAARRFSKAVLRDPDNADLHNYLGYSYRHLRQFEPAFKHYKRALALNPRHRGAHEYIGEAYLITGDLNERGEAPGGAPRDLSFAVRGALGPRTRDRKASRQSEPASFALKALEFLFLRVLSRL